MGARKLTVKQRRFVQVYLANGMKGADAYRAAYSANCSPSTAAREADRLLNRHPLIAPVIEAAKAKAAAAVEKAIDRYAVNKGTIAAELARIAYARMSDYTRVGPDGDPYLDFSAVTPDQMAAVAEITVEDFKDGRGEDARDVRRIRFKLADKRAALMDLARLNGHIVERRDVRLIKAMEDLSAEELAALAEAEERRASDTQH